MVWLYEYNFFYTHIKVPIRFKYERGVKYFILFFKVLSLKKGLVKIKCHYKNIFDRLRETIQHEKHKVKQGEMEIASLRVQVKKLEEHQKVLEKEK